ncbi:HlyD family secretion protein [Mesorhizobium sp. BAC0120]|uniref:HlyD family secretion protein n=1 Tax=Mesorhizobium sp. BAC0120 TaxID=3090670 RepID=UPI00298D43A7|nr:HlyD family secretion protein [Mesorhizobium sp. BAC0120]MDW6023496.1 HlyD family secretion protein [Mesorhizobium sp. BAC0120]
MSQAKVTPKARRTKPEIETETPPPETVPAREQASPRRSTLRTVLFVLGPLVALAIAAGIYFAGGRYVSEENAYVGAKTISVPAQVSGQITHVNVTQNQPVKAQSTLIEIDPESYRISVDAARSQLGMTRDELSAQLLTYKAQKQQADEAQANLTYAHQQLERSQQLVTRGIAAQSQLDAARRDEQSAAATLASARTVAQSTLAQLGGNGDVPVEQQPKFLAAKANLETAERNLRLTEVKAPWDGIVTNVDAAAVGSFVTAGQQAMSMVSVTDVWVDANIRETDLTYVRPGNPVELSVDAYPGVVFKGHVQTINPASGAVFALLPPQNASGNWVKVVQRIPVRIAIDHGPSDPVLRNGMSTWVSIDTGHRRTLSTLWRDIVGFF